MEPLNPGSAADGPGDRERRNRLVVPSADDGAVGHHEAAVPFKDGQAAFEQLNRLGAVSVRVELLAFHSTCEASGGDVSCASCGGTVRGGLGELTFFGRRTARYVQPQLLRGEQDAFGARRACAASGMALAIPRSAGERAAALRAILRRINLWLITPKL